MCEKKMLLSRIFTQSPFSPSELFRISKIFLTKVGNGHIKRGHFLPVCYTNIEKCRSKIRFNILCNLTLINTHSETTEVMALWINPLPDDKILDWSKLKQSADDNFEFNVNSRKFSKLVENTVGKGEIARYEQFLLFPQCFQKACFPGASKGVNVWEWVNPLPHSKILESSMLKAITHNLNIVMLVYRKIWADCFTIVCLSVCTN